MLGVWGAYMPFATALALLTGPLFIAACWAGAAGGGAWAACRWRWRVVLARVVPARHRRVGGVSARARRAWRRVSPGSGWPRRLRLTLAAPGPWLVAVTFAMYSGQWLAVIGFLPAIYAQAGVAGAATAVLTALAAAANIAGNVGSGRLLQRGVPAPRLLAAGFRDHGRWRPGRLRRRPGLACRAGCGMRRCWSFSGVGGLIPATLFALALRLAPGPATLSTTVGWVQQWSALGQFAGPPAVAWVASQAGGWHWTGLATAACSALGLLLTAAIAQPAAALIEAGAARPGARVPKAAAYTDLSLALPHPNQNAPAPCLARHCTRVFATPATRRALACAGARRAAQAAVPGVRSRSPQRCTAWPPRPC